jgi:hypothetical protein
MHDWQEKVDGVAQEIERYLESHPHAADSLEGISIWWMSRQRIRGELEVVRAALQQLVNAGVVSGPGAGKEYDSVYRLSEKSHCNPGNPEH